MEKSQVILWLFIPTNKESAKAIHPRMRPFHHASACFEPRLPLDRLGFFPAWANVSRKAEFAQDVTHLLVVVAVVETHPLRLRLGRLRTLDDDALDGRVDQLHVMTVRSLNRQADWDSMPLREQAAFHAALAAVGGIGAGFSPPRGALVIAPSIASQSQSIPHNSSNRSTPACHSLRNTPAATHS